MIDSSVNTRRMFLISKTDLEKLKKVAKEQNTTISAFVNETVMERVRKLEESKLNAHS